MRMDVRPARPMLLFEPCQTLLWCKQAGRVVDWSDVIMKERPDEGGPKTEGNTLNHLRTHPGILGPKVLRDWVDSNGRYFVLQERIQGQTFEQAWSSLPESQKIAIADQVVEVRNQLRYITSTSIQSVDQSPCYPLLFSDRKPHGPFHSDLELWDAISIILRETFPQRALENLKKRLPKCEPYNLTHCDLNLGNIMVKDGVLTGILDWEFAAYYPIWYEYVSEPLEGGPRRMLSGKNYFKSVWVSMVMYITRQMIFGRICAS